MKKAGKEGIPAPVGLDHRPGEDGWNALLRRVLLHPRRELQPARDAFLASYTGKKGVNQFTKVQMAYTADEALQGYFSSQAKVIESWFNIITPAKKPLAVLKEELDTLKRKRWQEIHA